MASNWADNQTTNGTVGRNGEVSPVIPESLIQAHAVAVQWKGGRTAKQTLAWFLKTALSQPKTIERVNLSWTALRVFVERDGDRNECLLHNNPRKQCNLSNWDMRKFTEVTFYKRSRNVFDVYREKKFTSKLIGIVYMECAVDRLLVDGRFTRECDQETSREGEVFPDLIDMKFPDRSSSSRKKHANKIEIDFNSLVAQGLQRDRDKEAKKQEKKERWRRGPEGNWRTKRSSLN